MPGLPKLQAPSWDSLAGSFLQSRQLDGCVPDTLHFYRRCLGPLLAWAKAEGISPDDFGPQELQAFLASLQLAGKRPGFGHKHTTGQLKQGTLDTYRRTIRAMLNYHAQRVGGAVYVFPKARAKKQKPRIPFLTDDELRRVEDACDNPRDRALLSFLLDTGLRRREASVLTWGSISWDGDMGTVLVEDSKTGEEGESCFTRKTWDLLADYWPGPRPDKAGMWLTFETPTAPAGKPLTPSGISLIFRRLSKKSGAHVHAHLMRHMCAKRYLERGGSLPGCQSQMRHKTSAMTMRYARFGPSMARAEFKKVMG